MLRARFFERDQTFGMMACQIAHPDSPVAVNVFDLPDSPDPPVRSPSRQPALPDVAAERVSQVGTEPPHVYTFWDKSFEEPPYRYREAYCHLLNCCQTDLLLLDRGRYWLSLNIDVYCCGTFDLVEIFGRLSSLRAAQPTRSLEL